MKNEAFKIKEPKTHYTITLCDPKNEIKGKELHLYDGNKHLQKFYCMLELCWVLSMEQWPKQLKALVLNEIMQKCSVTLGKLHK